MNENSDVGSNKVVTQVTLERWREAQRYEKACWLGAQAERSRCGKNLVWKALAAVRLKPKFRGDDYNYWWLEQFQGYEFLPKTLDNAIELGCGPFTNMRLIAEGRIIGHLFLSDHLMPTYVNFKMTYLAALQRKGFAVLDDHPIEQSPFRSNFFDLVVMINVLDHVQDAVHCVQVARALTKPGGYLMIGQDLSDQTDLAHIRGRSEEGGHPIRVDQEWCEKQVAAFGEPVVHKILTREQGRAPAAHYGTFIFAAKKNGATPEQMPPA